MTLLPPPPTVRAEPPAEEIVAALKPAKHRGRSRRFTDALVILLRELSLTIDTGTLRLLAKRKAVAAKVRGPDGRWVKA
jgi:hypothetical protein